MITVYIDGLAEPRNPGIGTFGYVIYNDGKKIKESNGFAGESVTNNYAEYTALLKALKELVELGLTMEELIIKSDSRLLVKQMSGIWKVKKGAYIERYKEVNELAKRFASIKFVWIPREENREADLLSRIAYRDYIKRTYR